MHHVCSHSNRSIFGNSPLLVFERNVRRAARKTTHNTETQAEYQLAKDLVQFQVKLTEVLL